MEPWRRAAACSALTVAAVAASCTGGVAEGDQFDASASTTAPGDSTGATQAVSAPEIPTVGVGERVTAAGYELVVHQVTAPAPAPNDSVTPGPGRMLMTVDVEVTNRTAGARDATYLRFQVVDPAVNRYSPSPAGENPPTGWIPADVPQRAVQLYEVPIDATGLVLTLQPDLVSGVAAAVRLR